MSSQGTEIETSQTFFTAVIVFLALAGCAAPDGMLLDERGLLVLDGVTILDPSDLSQESRAAVVVIKQDRILKIGKAGEFRFPADAEIRDLRGRYLLPGFIDTHFHVDVPPDSRQILLSTAIAFGVTTIRDTGPNPGGGPAVRDEIVQGGLWGPRMLTAGPLIDGTGSLFPSSAQPETVSDMRAVVGQHAASGVDSVKLYMYVQPDLLRAAIDEAHRLGLTAIGHLKMTSWTEAAEGGIDTLVHSGPEGPVWELLGKKAREQFARYDWAESFRQWALRSDEIELDSVPMQKLVDALIRNEVEVNPTLAIVETLCWGNDTGLLDPFDLRHASAADRGLWGAGWESGNPFMKQWKLTPEDYESARLSFKRTMTMINHLHQNGVLLTAGSDVSMPWVIPGVSYHRELELLVDAGISEADVLKIATLNGARALGLEEEVGSIAEGKTADLVVLGKNPLVDISNTRTIELVLLRGRPVEPETAFRLTDQD